MDKETILTRKRYNRTAKFYDIMERMIRSDVRKKVFENLTGRVLEVGVGTGKNLPFYPPECEVVGIDISPGMLERAERKLDQIDNLVTLIEMDVQKLEFPDDSFDAVVATCVFCSVPDPIKGLQEIRRVCKPGGKVILLEHVRSDNPILGLLMDILNPVTVRLIGPHINRRTVQNVEIAGFNILSVEDQGTKILKLIVAQP